MLVQLFLNMPVSASLDDNFRTIWRDTGAFQICQSVKYVKSSFNLQGDKNALAFPRCQGQAIFSYITYSCRELAVPCYFNVYASSKTLMDSFRDQYGNNTFCPLGNVCES